MALATIAPSDLKLDLFTQLLFTIDDPYWRIGMPEPGFLVGPLNMNTLFASLIVDHYPEVFRPNDDWATPFFVDDSPQAVIDRLKPVLTEAEGTYLVTITEFHKADEPSEGGWRWHKWGPYLGAHEPQCEYLHDEPEIDSAAVAHIYQIKNPE